MDDDAKAFMRALVVELTGEIRDAIGAISTKLDAIIAPQPIQIGVPKATIVTSAPSATPCSSSAGPDASWVVATKTTKSTPVLSSAAAPTAPRATVNAIPVDAVSSAVVAEVAAPTCPTPEQDTHFPSASVTTVALLQEGVSELVFAPAKHHDSSSPTSVDLKTLDVDPCVTCSMDCLPKLAMAVPMLDASSSSNPTEYGLNTNNVRVVAAVSAPVVLAPTIQLQQVYDDGGFFRPITSKVSVNRPMPWPSFTGVHVNGDETLPQPWGSFRLIKGCVFPSDTVEKASPRCSSDSSSAITCVDIGIQILDIYGNLSTRTGCIIIHNMCIPSVLRC